MKTKEERNALKKEVETESKERQKLTDDELEQVSGGGLNWGPFNDAVVPCYWCKQSVIIYKDRDVYCFHCGGLLRASLYE